MFHDSISRRERSFVTYKNGRKKRFEGRKEGGGEKWRNLFVITRRS